MEVDRNVAEQKVRAPAIGLLVAAVLGAVVQFGSIIATLAGFDFLDWAGNQGQPPEWLTGLSDGLNIGLSLLGLAGAGFMVFGALKLMRMESYGIVLTTCIVAMVPCLSPCCCIGLPVGIWALVVMHAPDVRPAFR